MAKKKNQKKQSTAAGHLIVAQNRKAKHDYVILDIVECGLALVGTEVKSLREGHASLVDAYATVDNGEIWLRGLHIPEYSHGTWTNHAPKRTRKLLLHRREIDSLEGKVRDGSNTLVPLSLYFTNGRCKVELALARGKQDYDRRESIKRRDIEREASSELGRKFKGLR